MSRFFFYNFSKYPSTCHPELVEISSSEERGEIEERQRRRDLLTNFGGLPKQMLHRFNFICSLLQVLVEGEYSFLFPTSPTFVFARGGKG